MKYSYLVSLLVFAFLFSGCKKDEETEEPAAPHHVTIYNHSEPSAAKSLATMSYSGDVMHYCGATNEEGEPDLVKSVSFDVEGRNELLHYLFDEEGRIELAYHSIDGVNQTEVHKLEYGALDSVYYSVHQFNWDNGVNFLQYEVGYGRWGDDYLGTVLYAKSGLSAIETANESIRLFSILSRLFVENLEEEDFTSIHFRVASKLENMVSWETPTIIEESADSSNPFECFLFENNPSPNGTPENPTGSLDECFNSAIQVSVEFGLYAVEFDISGGIPPYGVFIDGGGYYPIGIGSIPVPEIGTHTFVVIDSNGCTATVIAERTDICEGSDLAVDITSTPGSAYAQPSGGAPPYQLIWYSGETIVAYGEGYSNFSEGNYTCKVIDANLCETSGEVFVQGKCVGATTIVDVDGNVYPVVEIGGQCWMAENLRTESLNSGVNISNHVSETAWETTSSPGRCGYENDADNVDDYGYLYNFHAVSSPSGLCPTGWHVPNLIEMQTLVFNAGGTQEAGLALKSTTLWHNGSGSMPGTNSSGFHGVPGGYRDGAGYSSDYQALTIGARYWTSTMDGSEDAYFLKLSGNSDGAYIYSFGDLNDGHSVKCIKD